MDVDKIFPFSPRRPASHLGESSFDGVSFDDRELDARGNATAAAAAAAAAAAPSTPNKSGAAGADAQRKKRDADSRDGPPSSSGAAASSSIRFAKKPKTEYATLPRPRPLYPLNSKEWVALLRRKNTAAIGRDDVSNDEWFYRHMLPDEDLILDLFDIYFTRLHPFMPILHRPTLQEDVLAGRGSHDSAFRGLVFTVLAIASRFSSDPRVREDPDDASTAGDGFARASRLYHQLFAASLTNVQVLLLTATFMHGEVGSATAWTILGVAIRALQDIGLHQERAYAEFNDFEQEIRRRCFWGAFILDSMFAVNMGRPTALRLSDCTVRLPKDATDDAMNDAATRFSVVQESGVETQTVLTGWIALIKLCIIIQDVVLALYSPRWRQELTREKNTDYVQNLKQPKQSPEYKDMALLSKRLDEWMADTPEQLRTLQSPYKWQAGILQLGTHDCRLYILKPFLFDPILRRVLHTQCVEHAKSGLQVIIELFDEGQFAQDIVFPMQQGFMSTCTFMITVWHTTPEPEKVAEDQALIEATLRVFASFDARFFTQISKRAVRLLRGIAQRALPCMSAEYASKTNRALDLLPNPGLTPATTVGSGASDVAPSPANGIAGSAGGPGAGAGGAYRVDGTINGEFAPHARAGKGSGSFAQQQTAGSPSDLLAASQLLGSSAGGVGADGLVPSSLAGAALGDAVVGGAVGPTGVGAQIEIDQSESAMSWSGPHVAGSGSSPRSGLPQAGSQAQQQQQNAAQTQPQPQPHTWWDFSLGGTSAADGQGGTISAALSPTAALTAAAAAGSPTATGASTVQPPFDAPSHAGATAPDHPGGAAAPAGEGAGPSAAATATGPRAALPEDASAWGDYFASFLSSLG